MPRYRCVKYVNAWRIEKVTAAERTPTPKNLAFHLTDGSIKVKPADIAARYHPMPGDYLVQYDNNYWSVSPKEVFEGGYVLEEE